MITKDNPETAQAIKKEVGIGRLLVEVMPQDKAEEVEKLKIEGKVVALVGDGSNDARASATAGRTMALAS